MRNFQPDPGTTSHQWPTFPRSLVAKWRGCRSPSPPPWWLTPPSPGSPGAPWREGGASIASIPPKTRFRIKMTKVLPGLVSECLWCLGFLSYFWILVVLFCAFCASLFFWPCDITHAINNEKNIPLKIHPSCERVMFWNSKLFYLIKDILYTHFLNATIVSMRMIKSRAYAEWWT